MNKLIKQLHKIVSWNPLVWDFTSANAHSLDQLLTRKRNWQAYNPPESLYNNRVWFRSFFKKHFLGDLLSTGVELKIVADDSAYLWFGNIDGQFFAYEKVFTIENFNLQKNDPLYLYVIKTAGLTRIIDVQITPLALKKEVETIRSFILGITSAYKLLSHDTEQSNARKRVDPKIDKSNLNKNDKNELRKKLDNVLIPLKSVIKNRNIQEIYETINNLKPQLEKISNFTKKFQLTFVSNAHIDAAWLWRADETREVCDTTFAAVDKMMTKRKDFTFTQSSAVFYNWIEKKNPRLFNKIKKRVSEGRWEVIGGSWLEPDCNLISGESWIEQIRTGKDYFKRNFDVDEFVAFNPDSFGYNANLPMIYKHAEINTFFTQKIGWNKETVFPHRIFLWESKDGSRLLSYFPFDYVDLITDPFKFVDWLRQFEANTGGKDLLILFGIGDHGGGPTPEMFEKIDKLKDIIGYPSIKFDSVKNYLTRISKEVDIDCLPVWKDELYLEFHQGTFTTQANLKKYNRRLESKLTTLDKIQSLISTISSSQIESTDTFWKTILFNQFHDILPGSSIREVVIDAIDDYKKCESVADKLLSAGLSSLINQNIGCNGKYLTIFNPFNWEITEPVSLDSGKNILEIIETSSGQKINFQRGINKSKDYHFVATKIPPFGTKTYKTINSSKVKTAPAKTEDALHNKIENKFYSVEFDLKKGILKKITDKKNNKTISKANFNRLVIIEDKPEEWDAWNIDLGGKVFYPRFKKCELIEEGSVRSVFRFYYDFIHPEKIKSFPTKDFPTSFFEQDLILYSNLNRIDFETKVDWWEERMLLKVCFPTTMKNPKFNYEIPFGYIERKNPGENSFEKAKTEVPALKWVDISNGDYAIGILNNSKHGFDVMEGVLRMSLLRSPIWPDPTADRGKHTTSYSIITYKNSEDKTEIIKKAYQFNTPLPKVAHNKFRKSNKSFINIEQDNIILAAVKPSSDNQKFITLHFYETRGVSTNVTLELPIKPKSVYYSNIMQAELKEITCNGKKLKFEINAFALQSIKIKY